MLDLDDTIAALASPAGSAWRAVVRVSGPLAKKAFDGWWTPDDVKSWEHARLPQRHTGRLYLSGFHAPLPIAVQLWPTASSYTGQPSAEVHLVGSPPIVDAVLKELYVHGTRSARAGEFTLRAFLAGRIDLMQAEAVLGVIDAAGHVELETALEQLGGGVSGRIRQVHEQLLLHLADLEAGLDFVEEDIEFVSRDTLVDRLQEAHSFVARLIEDSARRMTSDGRLQIVLAGLPNAGKSTLFNALVADASVNQPTALVSEIAGTTRDYLSASLNWDGLAIELIDTAGWDATATGIALSADEHRRQQSERAHLVLWCRDASANAAERDHDERLFDVAQRARTHLLRVWTKADLRKPAVAISGEAIISAQTATGLDELKRAIASQLQGPQSAARHLIGTTAARCDETLRSASDALTRAKQAALDGAGEEIVAIEMRDAIDCLGEVVGATYTDDLLDRIFSRFCIGK